MTPAWPAIPQFQLVVDPAGTPVTYTNDQAFAVTVTRPENNIASAVLQVNDYQNKGYDAVFDPFTVVDVYFGANDSYTKLLRGHVHTVAPALSTDGETLEVGIWGNGWGMVKTHCNTSYGVESQNPTFNTVDEIITDIADNYVEERFAGGGGALTGWTLGQTKIEDVLNTLSITFLDGRYLDNFTLINRVCDVASAYAVETATVGPHWMVDASDNLYVKLLSADSADAAWTQYWKGSQALSTLTVTQDMILYNFKRHMAEYANHVILCSNLRKPGYDTWTESQATDTYWGENADVQVTQDAGTYLVGNYSLKATPSADVGDFAEWHFPKLSNAAWDLTKIGTQDSVPTLNFYMMVHDTSNIPEIRLRYDADTYWEEDDLNTLVTWTADKWFHISLPVGPYWEQDNALGVTWSPLDACPWTCINDIWFFVDAGDQTDVVYIDDLHFRGKIIREALRTTGGLTTYNDHQHVIINDVAVDDTLRAGTPGTTDTGTAARLARAELCRRSALPVTGMIRIPLAYDFLPGQKTHIHAARKADGTYAIDADFRAVTVTHTMSREGAWTVLNLTSDVTNSHAKAVPTQASMLAEYVGALGHREAKNLKGGGIDPLIPRLSETYTD